MKTLMRVDKMQYLLAAIIHAFFFNVQYNNWTHKYIHKFKTLADVTKFGFHLDRIHG